MPSKRILTIISILILFYNSPYCQTRFGVDIGFATIKSSLFGVKYFNDKNAFMLGFTYEFNDTKGKYVTEQLWNYGKTIDSTGEYLISIDFGYSREILDNFYLNSEISAAWKNYYTNYIDNRFDGGGYHMIEVSDVFLGYGLSLGLYITDHFGMFFGYNTIRRTTIGFEFKSN